MSDVRTSAVPSPAEPVSAGAPDAVVPAEASQAGPVTADDTTQIFDAVGHDDTRTLGASDDTQVFDAVTVDGVAEVDPAPAATEVGGDTGVRGVARGGLANLVGAAFAGLSGFIVAWIVTHALSKNEAGAFFASTAAFILIGTIAKLGTQTSLVYFPARMRTIGNIPALRMCLRVALVPVTIFSVLIGVAMWGFAHQIAGFAARNDHAEYAHQLRLLAVFLPLCALSDSVLAGTRGWRAMRPTVVLDRIVRPALQVGVLAILLILHMDTPAAFIVAWSAPYAVSAVLGWRSLLALLRASERRERDTAVQTVAAVDDPRKQATSELADVSETGFSTSAFWRFTWPRAFASIAQLALTRVDVLLLAGIAGLPAAAIYSVAGRFVVLGQFANQGISQAVQPRLAERLATDDRHNANLLYQIATTWLIIAAWPIYLLIGVFAMAVGSGCGMVDMVLAMAGRTSWNLMNVSAALAIQMAIDITLIPHLGPLGAAIGLGAAILINNIVPLTQIAVTMGIHPFGRASTSAAVLAIGCFGAVPLAIAAIMGTGVLAAAIAVGAGGLLYLLGLFRLRRTLQLDAFMQLRRKARAS
jgi:O-antigen/teichoic acid export membrane protein